MTFLEAIKRLYPVDTASLGLLQRIMLVSDGTLTDVIEAAFDEPVRIEKVEVTVQPASRRIDELDMGPEEVLMNRRILLKGIVSSEVFLYAESWIAVDRLPLDLRSGLLTSNLPLGHLWAECGIESRKELLGVRREPAGNLQKYFGGTTLLKRVYRFVSGRRPIILVNEYFPVEYRNK